MDARDEVAMVLLTTLGDLDDASARAHLQATEHSGDCTKDAWTCTRCYADEYREAADAVLAKLRISHQGPVNHKDVKR